MAASCMADKVIPFSEVKGMWYHQGGGRWTRLYVPRGGVHFVESVIGSCEIAKRSELFKRTALIVNFLQNDGFHDEEVEHARIREKVDCRMRWTDH